MSVKVRKENVEAAMALKNLNQVGLAEKMNMDASYLRNILAGRHTASPTFRENLMQALDIENTPENWHSLFSMNDDVDETSQPIPI